MFKSIKWRLTAVFFSVTAVFLFLLGFYLMNLMEEYLYDKTQENMVSYAKLLADNLKDDFSDGAGAEYFDVYAHEAQRDIAARVTVIDAKGQVLGDSVADKDSMVNHFSRPEIQKALDNQTGKAIRYSSSAGKRMIYFAVPVKKDNDIYGAVRVAVPWSEIEAGQNHIRWSIGTAIFVALILTVVVVSSFTSTLVVPLQEMTWVAKEMAEGKLDLNVDVKAKDEIGALGSGFNYMAQRLRDTISQITEERNKVSAILTSMNDGVIAIDGKGNILLINPAIERMFHIKYEHILGKSVIEVVRNFDLERLLHLALSSSESITRELQVFTPDPKTFRVSTAPLTNETGVVGVVAVMRDVTAFREVERMKTDFVANVSHELRTPLTSIKGFVETLLDGALKEPETARHFLEIINDEADRLNRLIGDLLSLSRIEAKQGEIHKTLVNLERLISNVVSVLSPQANEKSLSLNVDIKSPLPALKVDSDMIGQLMINLVDNAIKYTPEGGSINITAIRVKNGIKVAVKDTGIGIPWESIPRLFERFYRVDKARSREMGGTGLGLAIVKHILEVHGGTIDIASRVGRGSTFTFFLPSGDQG
ncbi:two-component system histidine kinase PnpS [Phosphitispora fastidiosa]|uniref:two-component system histidine kinase PnpS n=1 Tax=Phosphitispora fastidiosa TaxID=2837202 RepID=UPI001E2FC99D|nr:phosphate regulon sensor histidine kinase PhoR [Phosphitispora fastidiosa]MBU7008599.1 two-component system phosphate regulon sensor histidine kinase PhoR [Phosphitispora fastidiosa]